MLWGRCPLGGPIPNVSLVALVFNVNLTWQLLGSVTSWRLRWTDLVIGAPEWPGSVCLVLGSAVRCVRLVVSVRL